MPQPIRLFIVEDHMTTRVGLRVQLSGEDGIEVVDVAETMQEALEKCLRLRPDVVLLDLHLPDSSGPRTLLSTFMPIAPIVVFSAENRDSIKQKILDMGCGFVSKSESTKVLVEAIRTMANMPVGAKMQTGIHSGNPTISTPNAQTAPGGDSSAGAAAAAGSAYQDPYMGTIVDEKYQIVSLLGVGGYSNVYRANDLNVRRSVALKILHSHLAQKPETAARFQREATAAMQLMHPNVAKIYETGLTENGQPYIAMEYITGRNLEQLLEETPIISPRRIIYIVRQVCAGLQAAHDHGIVHRDVKPGNIHLGSNDLVKLLDFGLAKSITAGDKSDFSLTAAGTVLGTPSYMSPEQCQGIPLDGRADLYSVGCVMYEMVTGRQLFVAPTLYDVMTQHVSTEPDYQYLRSAPIPHRLQNIIVKLLHKSPAHRYRTARELTYELSLVECSEHSDTQRSKSI